MKSGNKGLTKSLSRRYNNNTVRAFLYMKKTMIVHYLSKQQTHSNYTSYLQNNSLAVNIGIVRLDFSKKTLLPKANRCAVAAVAVAAVVVVVCSSGVQWCAVVVVYSNNIS